MIGSQQKQKLIVSQRMKTVSRHLDTVLREIKTKFGNARQLTCAAKAKMLFRVTFWTVIYLAGSYLTFSPSIDIIQNYLSSATSTQIINVINNTNMAVPNFTMCFQADVTKFFGIFETDLQYTTAMEEFFEDTTSEGNFTVNLRALYSDEVYILIWNYLAMIYEAEFFSVIPTDPFGTLNLTNDGFAALTKILVPTIDTFNITIDQLKSVFDGRLQSGWGDYSCFLFVVIQHCSDLNNEIRYCASSENISYIGNERFCFTMSGIQSTIDSCDISNPELILGESYDPRFANAPVAIDFSGKGTPLDLSIAQYDDSVLLVNYGDKIAILINVLAITQKLPKVNGVFHCSEDTTETDCINVCMSEFVLHQCGCAPMILPVKQEKRVNCTLAVYTKCLNNSNFADSDQYFNCKAACLPNCELWHYTFEKKRLAVVSEVIVEFKFLSFEYVIFLETKQSFGDFLSALGGALAIWLGLDFIILIQLIFQPIMMVARRCLAMTDINEEEHRVEEMNEANESYLENLKKLVEKYTNFNEANPYLIAIWILEKIFWAAIYIIGAVYTAYYYFTICQQYLLEETYSRAALMYNKSITLPPATLCIATTPFTYHYAAHNFITLNSFNNSIAFILEALAIEKEKFDQKTYSAELESIFSGFNKASVLGYDTIWPPIMLYIASLYLSILQIAESNSIYSDSTFPSLYSDTYTIQWVYDNYFNDSLETEEISAIENILEPMLNNLNISRDELQQKLGQDFINMMRMEVNFYGSTNSTPLNNNTRLSYLGLQQICFTLPLDTVSFFNELDHIKIAIKGHFLEDTKGLQVYGLDFSAHLIEFNQTKINSRNFRDGSFLTTSSLQNMNRMMGVYGHYIQVSQRNGLDQCTTDRSQEICQVKCRIEQIEKLCNCSPTTWPMLLNPGSNNCTLTHYKNCLRLNITEYDACQDKCLPPCEHWTFTFEDHITPMENCMQVNVYVKDYTYLVFQDQFILTFSSLLASLGGALGLCLGLDVRFIIWIIITPVMMIIGLIFKLKIGSVLSELRIEKLKRFANYWMENVAHIVTFPESDEAILQISLENQAKTMICLIKFIFWTAYYLIGFGLTSKMCNDFYLQFRAGPTDFTYVLQQNSTVQFIQSVTICLPISVSLNETEEQRKECDNFFVNLADNQKTWINISTVWSECFLTTTLSYLALYSNYEQLANSQTNSRREIEMEQNEMSAENALMNTFDLYDKQLKKAHITIDELRQKCGQEARNRFHFDVQQYFGINETFGNHETLEINKTTFIGDDKICYNLPISKLSTTSDYVSITIQPKMSDILETSTLLNLEGTISVDLLGRDVTNIHIATPSLLFDSTLLLNFNETVTSKIYIDGFYQALPYNDGVQKCSDQITLEDCQNACRIDMIQKNCSCSPVSWPDFTSISDGMNCNLQQYQICLSISGNNNNSLESCMANCFRNCTRIRFGDERNYIYNDTTELVISMKSFSYRLEQEYISFAFIDFVGAFGGALGFWIGLDVLMIVHVIYSMFAYSVHLLLSPAKYFDSRKRVAAIQQEQIVDVMELKSV